MAIEKRDFDYDIIPDIGLLQEYYNNNFQRTMLINFLPFFSSNFEDMKSILLGYEYFTTDDFQYFVNPFIEILNKESAFYFSYWDAIHANTTSLRNIIEPQLTNEFAKYSCVFKYYKKSLQAILSHSITKNGRGLNGIENYFTALAPLKDNVKHVFYTIFHEITHAFTDELLQNINMDDGSHAISENIVILADYYMIKAIDPSDIPNYLQWLAQPTESCLLSAFSIDKELDTKLQCLLSKIL